MVFSSTIFLFVFLPLLFITYYLPVFKRDNQKNRKWKNSILLLFSIGFYAWGEPAFVFVMLATILVNWFFVIVMEKNSRHKKTLMAVTVAIDVLLLVVFKYAGFITKNIAALTGNDKLILSIALPIGISFFTFQMISYVLDVYFGKAEAQHNPLDVALYITLFPQLIAGPIVRYQDVSNEIKGRKENLYDFSEGVKRFIYGLGKKVLIANFLAEIVDNIFDYIQTPTVLMAWIGAIGYFLQLYFDFSGYSDMAIGLGRMFGFHFLENFNYPLLSKSVTEFWQRWHISLGTWFRDYVYIPLGGSRVKKHRWIFNIFIVWLLTGIWHGADWKFIVWGLLSLVAILLEKLTGFDKKLGVFKHIYVVFFFSLSFVMFRAADLSKAFQYIGYMFGINSSGFANAGVTTYLGNTYVVLIAAIIGCTPLVFKIFEKLKSKRLGWIENVWLLLVFIISIFEIVSSSYNPFIYFNF